MAWERTQFTGTTFVYRKELLPGRLGVYIYQSFLEPISEPDTSRAFVTHYVLDVFNWGLAVKLPAWLCAVRDRRRRL